MNSQARGPLVQALCRTYTLEQLNQVVREFLGNNIEFYATAGSYPALVDNLLDELDRATADLLKLLLNVFARTTRPELKSTIAAYLEIAGPTTNPYDSLVIFDQPFVNRATLRRKLKDLFDGSHKRVLLMRGTPGSGRSYCLNLVQHAAEATNIKVAAVDLVDTPDPADLIGQIINTMSLDPRQLRDRVAQLSTQGKGLASALRGEGARFTEQGQRWCVVIDHFDREEVSDTTRELFIPLVQDVARRQIANIWVVVLGFTGQLGSTFRGALVEDELLPLSKVDVEQYLAEIVQTRNAQNVNQPKLVRAIFSGLSRRPLVGDALMTMSQRLSNELDGL